MRTVTSADGTKIAFDQLGEGPPVIMVVGAFNTRATTGPLAAALQDQFTVLNYDRRGRGDSGDTLPYSVEREIEDIDALIADAGGSAAVFGYSSGATLALNAAAHGLAITKLVLYDAPFLVDDSDPRLPADLPEQLTALISAGKRGDAVELYQTKAIRIPEDIVAQMRHAPFRPGLEAIAHTLVYEAKIAGDGSLPRELIAKVATPTLVIDGENSPPIMHGAAQALEQTLPNARRCTLPEQTHDINPDATAPVLTEFLSA
jgi:pimeloyl-ACP methyl ester carboxylesterase